MVGILLIVGWMDGEERKHYWNQREAFFTLNFVNSDGSTMETPQHYSIILYILLVEEAKEREAENQ